VNGHGRRSNAEVMVIAGPEWTPVRERFLSWLPEIGQDVRIATLEDRPLSPTGRVAGWIRSAAAGRGATAEIVVPGRDHLPQDDGITWVGVTELLLDPDPTQVEQLHALGIWTRFASRGERFRLRFSSTLPHDIAGFAARFRPTMVVTVGEWSGLRLVVAGQDLIAVEVVSRAIRAIGSPAGDVGLSPWQAPIVQAAIEPGLGVSGGHQFQIRPVICTPVAPGAAADFTELMGRVSRLLDTELLAV
jgi:hypothetical protein